MRKGPTPRPAPKPAKPETHTASQPTQSTVAGLAGPAKSNIRKILLASPDFPRFYADLLLTYAPNSKEARILAPHYKKIFNTNPSSNKEERTTMPNVKSCTHIKVTGVPCGSPALRGEPFCYFHQRLLRTVRWPESRLHQFALLEDAESIQTSIMELINALLCGGIDFKRGEIILRALNTAVRNARRVHFGIHASTMVKEVPNYDDEPATAEAPAPASRKPSAGVKEGEQASNRSVAAAT